MHTTTAIGTDMRTADVDMYSPHIVQISDREFVIKKCIKSRDNKLWPEAYWADSGNVQVWLPNKASYYSSMEEAKKALKEAEYHALMTDLASIG